MCLLYQMQTKNARNSKFVNFILKLFELWKKDKDEDILVMCGFDQWQTTIYGDKSIFSMRIFRSKKAMDSARSKVYVSWNVFQRSHHGWQHKQSFRKSIFFQCMYSSARNFAKLSPCSLLPPWISYLY